MDIIVPAPVPEGRRMQHGETPTMPVCDRCRRQTTEANPILIDKRPSHILAEALKGQERVDALCVECRQYLKRWR